MPVAGQVSGAVEAPVAARRLGELRIGHEAFGARCAAAMRDSRAPRPAPPIEELAGHSRRLRPPAAAEQA